MSETNRIEYKLKLHEGLEKEVVAFLNYHEGGIIYIGIDKLGNNVGVDNRDGNMLIIKDRLKNNIVPSCMGLFDVRSIEKEGKDIIEITVASGSEKPYYIKKYGMSEKGCFIRIGTAAEPMPQKMIDDLFAKRTRNTLRKIKSYKQDLNFEQLKIYYEESGYKLTKKFASNLELLTEAGEYNYVAYLMADNNSNSIKVAKYAGTSRADLIETNEYGNCSLIKATKQVLDKLELENKTTSTITSKERVDIRLWSPIAIREAVINAIVHNDYTNEVTPKFELFSDRLVITSAGGLTEGLSQQEFLEGYSVPRNKEIMRIFKDVELVEQLGSGIPRILEYYSKDIFIFSENFLRIEVSAIEPLTAKDILDELSDAPIGGQVDDTGLEWEKVKIEFGLISKRTEMEKEQNIAFLQSKYRVFAEYLRTNFGQISDELRTNFGDGAHFVLMLIAIHQNITAKMAAKIIGVSSRTVETYHATLKREGIIERTGPDNKGNWMILKKSKR